MSVQQRPDGRWRARYRDATRREHSKHFARKVDAQRWERERRAELDSGSWVDPNRSTMTVREWTARWVPSRVDLRDSTRARLEVTMKHQVLPAFGSRPLGKIRAGEVSDWVGAMTGQGLSAATIRKAVFALRQCLDAAVRDGRLQVNPAARVPLPTEPPHRPRFLTRREVATLTEAMPTRVRPMVLAGAYAGLRWGEVVGLTRSAVDVDRSRIHVRTTATEVRGQITLGQQPKTARSVRSVPVASAVMGRLSEHLQAYVGAEEDALVFCSTRGTPLFRGTFGRQVWRPATERAGLAGLKFHELRHTFVAIMIEAGCNVREVSEWCGHNSVGFTLTRYGGLFEDQSDRAVQRLDALLAGSGAD